jgi:DNA-binding NarL/FixJ family response regulator
MAAGAMGYLGKDAPDEELVRAILTVHEGSLVLSDSARRSLNSRGEPGDSVHAG